MTLPDSQHICAASAPTVAPTNALNDTSQNVLGPGSVRERVILGGTDAYAGATGVVTVTFAEDTVDMDFDMSCQ
ncbi:MAG: hypothetical protein AAF414_09500 [Pseudomonadota bacterium]